MKFCAQIEEIPFDMDCDYGWKEERKIFKQEIALKT